MAPAAAAAAERAHALALYGARTLISACCFPLRPLSSHACLLVCLACLLGWLLSDEVVTGYGRLGKKTHLFTPFHTKTRSFYQDRLGTNIGKALTKRGAFLLQVRGSHLRTSLAFSRTLLPSLRASPLATSRSEAASSQTAYSSRSLVTATLAPSGR